MAYAQEQLAQLFEKESIPWEPLISIGHTADEISRIVDNKRIDLAISATHGRSGLQRLLLGSVTERLMRTLADFDNYRKRMTREQSDAIKRAGERIVAELQPYPLARCQALYEFLDE